MLCRKNWIFVLLRWPRPENNRTMEKFKSPLLAIKYQTRSIISTILIIIKYFLPWHYLVIPIVDERKIVNLCRHQEVSVIGAETQISKGMEVSLWDNGLGLMILLTSKLKSIQLSRRWASTRQFPIWGSLAPRYQHLSGVLFC